MAKEKTAMKKEEVKKEELFFEITFPDGTKTSGSTTLREFKPRADGKQNEGFQVKIASGQYSGSLMIVDYLKQKRI